MEPKGDETLGLERGVLPLVPYCDEWPFLYSQEAGRIRKAIGEHVHDVQHIGSTAIPRMPAKPIIDIAVGADCLDGAQVCIKPLQSIGYEYRWRDENPESHYLVKGNPTEYHLRIFKLASEDWEKHIRFRDRLRQDPRLAREYCELKLRLFTEFRGNRKAYQEGKTSFVQKVAG